jgi:diacylglycerol kinase (ATP)
MLKLHKELRSSGAESKATGENPLLHIIKAGGYSLAGLGAALKHEMAFRIEVACLIFLLPILVVMPVGLVFKGLLLGSMLLILIVELLNSAMEAVVDFVSPGWSEMAKRAKDMGSAAVLVALINAGALWIMAIIEWRSL